MNEQIKKCNVMKKIIVNLICLVFCMISAVYVKTLFDIYPEVKLTQQELYGTQNKNLKDFEITENGLLSITGDPWIEYELDQRIPICTIELNFSNIVQKKQSGEIYNIETWSKRSYDLRNGKILVYYEQPEQIKKLRFDLVSNQSVQLQINYIILNSRYGLLFHAIQMIGLFFVLMLVAIIYFLLLEDYIEKNPSCRRIKICGYCIGGIGIFLAGVIFYNIFIYHIETSLLYWFSSLLVSFFLYGSICIIRHMGIAVVFGIEPLVYSIINIGLLETLSGMEFDFKNWSDGIWNLIYILFIISIFYILIRNKKIVHILINMIVIGLGVANHYFYKFRGNPLELTDVLMAKTAVTVIGTYEFQIDNTIFFVILVEIGFIVCMIAEKRQTVEKKKKQSAIVFIFLSLLGINSYSAPISYWNMVASTQNIGYLNSFIAYARRDMKIEKPEGYSKKTVSNILNKYEVEDTQDKDNLKAPNIIVIMDETFSDLPTIYGFETNEDGMPFVHSLKENTIQGNLLVSVFGGSTANTEFEFLTGNSVAFLHSGVVPYMQYIKRNQESLAAELKSYGYQTIAFHPNNANNYKRSSVYPYLGFERFITIDDELNYSERLRGYMSDDADIKNVIDIYENRDQSKPFFLFNVTMQNHGDYNRTQSEIDVTVSPKNEDLQYAQLLEYLSLIKKTDEAIEGLIEYFSQIEDDTIILIFGDHQPGLDSDIYEAMDSELYQEIVNINTREKMYMVPFVIWANYDIIEDQDIMISPGYLRAFLMKNTGLPLSNYEKFLLDCKDQYPAINFIGYYDKIGNCYEMEENVKSMEWLQDYWILEYGNMFDKSLNVEMYE